MAKKKVLKQKQKQKQTQKQSVIIHLGKSTQRKAPTKPTPQPSRSMQPIIVQATQPLFPTPSYDFSRLENKIADLAKLSISKPIDPVISETISMTEMKPNVNTEKIKEKVREARSQYPAFAEPVLESEMVSATEAENIPVRRGRIPVAKTAEQLEAERLARNTRARERYAQRKKKED